ncbi:MAG TPA: cytochrome P460 family protein, partial [Polyangiaceae bacterium]|nr:cytochrome P460 family protein [Polyangiaceae bacterium]
VISANLAAASVYPTLVRGGRFPEGAVLVKRHTDASSGAPGPIFAMIKRARGFFPDGGDWEYLATSAKGSIDERGPLAPCARCHAEAPSDWVFGAPREP